MSYTVHSMDGSDGGGRVWEAARARDSRIKCGQPVGGNEEGDAAQPSKRARQGASPPKAAAPAAEDEDAALRAIFPGGFGGSKHAPR